VLDSLEALGECLLGFQSDYHKYCPIQYGDRNSEQNCWMGDTKVTLPDVK
jgi:hypothetical protein